MGVVSLRVRAAIAKNTDTVVVQYPADGIMYGEGVTLQEALSAVISGATSYTPPTDFNGIGTEVGDIVWRHAAGTGYLPCDGSAVSDTLPLHQYMTTTPVVSDEGGLPAFIYAGVPSPT